jgi:hypothetical protein
LPVERTALIALSQGKHAPPPAIESAVPSETAAPAPSTATSAARSEARAAAPLGQLGREVAMIDRARRALAGHHYAQVLAVLDEYGRASTTGSLDREARVLRIEALRRSGDIEGAERLAAQYLSEFPDDAHGTRLRALDAGTPR